MGYKQERNKAAAMDFYTTMVNHKDPQTAMDKYGASYYRQHNPHVEDKKEGFIKHFKALAISNPHEDFYPRVIAEDDLVLMHVWHHELPAHFPYEKTLENYKRYGLMSFDIFRFSEEGRIMEHWDSMQWSPFPASFNEIGLVEVEPWWPEGTYSRLEEPLCTSPMMEGETEIRDLDKTQQNKEIARQFVQDILMDKRFDEAEKYLADNMTHHVCYMHDGKNGYLEGIRTMKQTQGIDYIEPHRAVAEGNFVGIQSQINYRGRVTSVVDLFRLEDGKIAEVWECLFESVPETAAHQNTLF